MTVGKEMVQVEGHDSKCQNPTKARRLYIRKYNSLRKKQVFTIWGIVCLSCRMVVELKPAVIKGNENRSFILNRGEKRTHKKLIQNMRKKYSILAQKIQKTIDNTPDPVLKAQLQKTLDNAKDMIKKLK
jgi:hypothetical protein